MARLSNWGKRQAPVIGAAGLVTFATQCQVELFRVGLAFNAGGIVYIGSKVIQAYRGACKMRYRGLIKFLLSSILGAAMLFGSQAYAAELAQQSSAIGDVTVTVKPMEVSAGKATWSFLVKLKTHSQELNDDLASAAYIVGDTGKKSVATGWEGNAPGGHDRKGILRFNALTPPPGALELHIQRPGESAPRKFSWKLK